MNTNNETHSPAPWEIGYRLRMDGVREPDRIMSADGNNVCEGLSWTENAKRDAPLLRAAPELLEALRETLAEMESLMKARGTIYRGGINISNRARAAIAKATTIE